MQAGQMHWVCDHRRQTSRHPSTAKGKRNFLALSRGICTGTVRVTQGTNTTASGTYNPSPRKAMHCSTPKQAVDTRATNFGPGWPTTAKSGHQELAVARGAPVPNASLLRNSLKSSSTTPDTTLLSWWCLSSAFLRRAASSSFRHEAADDAWRTHPWVSAPEADTGSTPGTQRDWDDRASEAVAMVVCSNFEQHTGRMKLRGISGGPSINQR